MAALRTTAIQRKDTRIWRANNRKKVRIYNDRSATRRYIRHIATLRGLRALKDMINKRVNEIKQNKKAAK